MVGSAHEPLKKKEVAFHQLRAHFCPELTAAEKQQTVAAVDQQRYETRWPAPPPEATSLDSVELADKVRGLIFGAALGDATGLATEFLSRDKVQDFYGTDFAYAPKPARVHPDTHRMMWTAGDWTDDTDQLVLLTQSLLQSGGSADPLDFAARLVRWRESGFAELGDKGAAGLGQQTKGVISHPEYMSRPAEVAHEQWAQGGHKGAANGAVMRCAACGVPSFWSRADVVANTTALCLATHADPRCVASCVAVSVVIAELLRGTPAATATEREAIIADAVASAAAAIGAPEDVAAAAAPMAETAHAKVVAEADASRAREAAAELRRASGVATPPPSLRELALDEPRAIGYTYKCLGAGLWAFRAAAATSGDGGRGGGGDGGGGGGGGKPEEPITTDDELFERTIRALVAEGGDADTNAAVAGALLGCRLGFSKLPSAWVAQLPHRAWLEAHVQKVLFMLRLR